MLAATDFIPDLVIPMLEKAGEDFTICGWPREISLRSGRHLGMGPPLPLKGIFWP